MVAHINELRNRLGVEPICWVLARTTGPWARAPIAPTGRPGQPSRLGRPPHGEGRVETWAGKPRRRVKGEFNVISTHLRGFCTAVLFAWRVSAPHEEKMMSRGKTIELVTIDGVTAELVARLQRSFSDPSLSVMMTTTPGPELASHSVLRLDRTIERLAKWLKARVAAERAADMLARLQSASVSMRRVPATRALAIYVSETDLVAVQLPVIVADRTVVGPTFATRDLLPSLGRSIPLSKTKPVRTNSTRSSSPSSPSTTPYRSPASAAMTPSTSA